MKFFISYCNNDGLMYAFNAASILEANLHIAWYFDRDKSTGILRAVDITNHIRYWCDKILFLCTDKSIHSDGQWKEIGQWDQTNKQILVIPIDNARVPDVIDPYIYTKIHGKKFVAEFQEFVQNRLNGITDDFEEWTKKISIKNE